MLREEEEVEEVLGIDSCVVDEEGETPPTDTASFTKESLAALILGFCGVVTSEKISLLSRDVYVLLPLLLLFSFSGTFTLVASDD